VARIVTQVVGELKKRGVELDIATFVQNIVFCGVSVFVSGKALAAGSCGKYRRLAPCRSQKVALSD
jgi:hypothetical protein